MIERFRLSCLISSFTMEQLSPEQSYAFQRFQRGENLFISGPGGSGKSFLIKHFVNHLFTHGRIHQVTSTTGCSCVLLSNAIQVARKPIPVKTIHSWSGIRLAKGPIPDIVHMVLQNKRVVKEWKRVKTLIVDEVSMMSCKIFELLDQLARVIRGNSAPFGGIQLVCLGDMFQLPPVGDFHEPESSQFCFESAAWSRVFSLENHIELKTIFRQTDPVFRQILNEVRIGQLSDESKLVLQSRVGVEYRPEDHGGVNPMKIFPMRHQVNMVNTSQYNKVQDTEFVYTTDVMTHLKVYMHSGEPIDEDTLERCKNMTSREIEYESYNMVNNLPANPEIRLKRGVPVMCLANLDVESGIANGSMGVIEDFVKDDDGTAQGTKVPRVRFYNGVVEVIKMQVWQSSEIPTIGVSQIPLCLAYSNSIHKMQGATLDVCEMDLGKTIFEEHQIYVALSRVKTLDGLYLSAFHPHRIRVNPKVVRFYQTFGDVDLALDAVADAAADASAVAVAEPDNTPLDAGASATECPVCMETLDKPYMTECKHAYCYDCLTRLISTTHLGRASCPLCREPVTMKTIQPVGGSAKKAPRSAYRKKPSIVAVKKLS